MAISQNKICFYAFKLWATSRRLWMADQRMPSNILNSLLEYTTIPIDTKEKVIPLEQQ